MLSMITLVVLLAVSVVSYMFFGIFLIDSGNKKIIYSSFMNFRIA